MAWLRFRRFGKAASFNRYGVRDTRDDPFHGKRGVEAVSRCERERRRYCNPSSGFGGAPVGQDANATAKVVSVKGRLIEFQIPTRNDLQDIRRVPTSEPLSTFTLLMRKVVKKTAPCWVKRWNVL
jgi:hypothetical protein